MVLRKMTTLYCARFTSLNRVGSSVASTVKLFVAASIRIIWMPLVIDGCRNPAVAEKSSALKAAAHVGNGAAKQRVDVQSRKHEAGLRRNRQQRSTGPVFTPYTIHEPNFPVK